MSSILEEQAYNLLQNSAFRTALPVSINLSNIIYTKYIDKMLMT